MLYLNKSSVQYEGDKRLWLPEKKNFKKNMQLNILNQSGVYKLIFKTFDVILIRRIREWV